MPTHYIYVVTISYTIINNFDAHILFHIVNVCTFYIAKNANVFLPIFFVRKELIYNWELDYSSIARIIANQ